LSGALKCIGPGTSRLRALAGMREPADALTTMRAHIRRRFDVLVVIWALALALGFCFVAISRSDPSGIAWDDQADTTWVWTNSGE
jgi:hypothetical protein